MRLESSVGSIEFILEKTDSQEIFKRIFIYLFILILAA